MKRYIEKRVIIDFTSLTIKYFESFSKIVPTLKFVDKNWEVAKTLSNSYVWGAIYIADVTMRVCKKLKIDNKNWLLFKASQYEKLSNERKDDLVSLSFIEKAMSIYRRLEDENNTNRLQKRYQNLRTKFKLSEIYQEIPQCESQRIRELIKREIREKEEEEIIKTLLLTPMISPLKEIQKWAEDSFKETMLHNLLPVSIYDNFGNTVAKYITKEERKNFSFLKTYELHLQIAKQTIVQYFIEAFQADKISATGIINLLHKTWIGKDTIRFSNGREYQISYIKQLEPGINSFFRELNKWKSNTDYSPDFVCATDSLVLKAEYLLREFYYLIGIATFRPNPRNPEIIMEKTLDIILDDLNGKISADDLFFIKFILTDKAGYNLRNRIAHGLMDNIDYSLEYPILSILIILKISNYQFASKNN